MKRKKSLLLLWSIVAVIVGGGLIYVGGRLLLLRRALELRSEGLAAAAAGDDARAADLLLQYVHRRPRDTDAMKSYIQARQRVPMTSGAQYAETIGILKLLLQRDPSLVDDQRYLLEMYVTLERGPEAIETADAILKRVPRDAKTLGLKTQSLIQQRMYQEALNCAQEWTSASPDDLQAQMSRLKLEFQLGRPPETVVAEAQNLAKYHQGDARFEALQAFACGGAGDRQNADKWLQTAAKNPGLTDDVAQNIVEQYDSMGDSIGAIAVLQDRVKQKAGSNLRHQLAQRLWELRQWAPAAELLNDLKASDPKVDATLLAQRVICLVNSGHAADGAADRAALTNSSQPEAHAWAGLLKQIIDNVPTDDKQLILDLRAAVGLNHQNPYLECFLGEAEVRLGELDLAISSFSRAANLDRHWNIPAVRLVDCLLATGQTEQAVAVARIIASRKPLEGQTAVTIVQAYATGLETGEIGQADKLLEQIADIQKQLPNENSILPAIRVQILAEQDKKAEAIQAARQAINRVPPAPPQVFRLVATLSRRFSLGLEAECFSAWQRADGITSSLASMRATFELEDGRPQDGLKVFDDLAKQSGKSGDVDWRLARTQYLDYIGDPASKAAWTALSEAYPNELKVQQAAVNGRTVRNDWTFMQPVIERLHKLTGDTGLAWRLAQARLKIEAARGENDYEQGSVELNSLIEAYPQLDEPHVLLAEALLHMKRFDGAISQLSLASKLNPSSATISLDLVNLLQSRGDTDKASRELDRIILYPLSPQERRQVAVLLSKQGNASRAIALLEQPKTGQSAATRPAQDDDRDLLLAALYRGQHQTDKSEAIVRDLLNHPNLQLIQFAASLFQADGHPDDAEKALKLLDDLKLNPGVKELILANFYEGSAHNETEAARYFNAATRAAPGNSMTWLALAVFQMSTGHPTDAMATVDAGCRAIPGDAQLALLKQKSALLLDAGANEGLRPLAISVLENPRNSSSDLELIDLVVAAHRANDLENLAVSLRQISEKAPDDAPAQLQLIQCYMDMGRVADALAAAQHAMAVFPHDPAPAQAATMVCKSAGRWQEMESAAVNWKARAPDMAEEADAAAADAENNLHNYQSALNELQPYLIAAKADAVHHSSVVSEYVIASVGAGDLNAASDVLWPFAQQSPEGRQLWIEVAARQLDQTQAVDWLNRVAQIIPPGALLERCVLADAYDELGRRLKNQQLIAASVGRFDELVKDPQATGMVFLAAGAEAERSGNMANAESFYRRAAAMDQSLWLADNNLAMVIINRGGDAREAEKFARAALNARPHDAELFDTLAEVQAKSGDLSAAAQSLRIALKLRPDNLMWRVRLATYLLDAGSLAEASKVVAAIDTDMPDLSAQPADLRKQLTDIRQKIHGNGT